MGAATLTAAGKVLTTIFKAGSPISEISDFWSVFSSIKGILDNHKGISSVIDNAVNKAWGKSGRTNYLGMRPSNSQLIELVIKKYRKESVEIPNNWFRDDEFEKFYNILIDDQSFWNIFMELFQNYENSRQKETLEGIRESTNVIKGDIEKTKLPDWLITYDVELSTNINTAFLQDAHENIIRENKIYRKEESIKAITSWLNTSGVCLIIAPEGRGKTFLSRIIAFDFQEKGIEVYFADCRKADYAFFNKLGKLLFDWNKDKEKNRLLILENIHALSEPAELKKTINNQNQDGNLTNVKFLLNARPTILDFDCFSDWNETISLKPDKNDVEKIVDLYRDNTGREPFSSTEEMDGFIKSNSPSDESDSYGANLRFLNIYLRTWQKHEEIRYVSDVREEHIFNDFIEAYGLDKSIHREPVLSFVSGIFQFDVPLHLKAIKQYLENESVDMAVLGQLVKEGLLIQSRKYYYMPHSVEAYFLFKAICHKLGEEYKERAREFVKYYLEDFILQQHNPRDFENDFRLLVSGLIARKDEYKVGLQYLTQEDVAKIIITKLNPAFVLNFFNTNRFEDPDASVETLMNYYKKNKKWLKTSILGLDPYPLGLVVTTFNNYLNHSIVKDFFKTPKELGVYLEKNDKILFCNQVIKDLCELKNGASYKTVLRDHYTKNKGRLKPLLRELSPTLLTFVFIAFRKHLEYDIVQDVFETPNDLDVYLKNNSLGSLSKTFSGDGKMIAAIRKLGEDYILVLEKYMGGSYPNHYDYFMYSSKNGYGVFQKSIDYYYGTKQPFDVNNIPVNGFYFAGVHWGGMQRFVKVIQKNMNDENRQHSIELVKAIIQKVLDIKGSLSHASAENLSYFYTNIAGVDYETYQQLMENKSVIADIKRRLGTFEFTLGNLYLLSNFYSQPWCKEILDQKIDNADDVQKAVIIEWYDKVIEGVGEKGIDSESLLSHIQQQFYPPDNLL